MLCACFIPAYTNIDADNVYIATKPGVKQDEEEKPKTEEVQEAPKEPSKFEFSSDMPAMSAQDL
jgi:hypothetical protein